MTPITAVLFDYGMVLTAPPDPTANERMRTTLDADPIAFNAAYWQYRDDYDRGTLNAPSYWLAVATALDKPLTVDTLRILIEADTQHWTQPNAPMIAWAQRLHAAGIKTGILSNLGDAMEQGVLEAFPWLHDFTHTTFSHRLGIAKPDPEIYAEAIAGLATPAAEILFIDDKPENIAAAEAAGLQALQYTTHNTFRTALRQRNYPNLPLPD